MPMGAARLLPLRSNRSNPAPKLRKMFLANLYCQLWQARWKSAEVCNRELHPFQVCMMISAEEECSDLRRAPDGVKNYNLPSFRTVTLWMKYLLYWSPSDSRLKLKPQ